MTYWNEQPVSPIERDFLIILDFDVNVRYFARPDFDLESTDTDGGQYFYKPTMYVEYRTDITPAKNMKPLLCEVIYRKTLFEYWRLLKPGFKAARRFARKKKWDFRILTETEIRIPYLENAKFLRSYMKEPTNWEHYKIITGLLTDLRLASPQQVLLAYSEDKWKQAELLWSLWHLVAKRIVRTDLTLPLTMNSDLWYPF